MPPETHDSPNADKLDAIIALLAEGDRAGAAALAGMADPGEPPAEEEGGEETEEPAALSADVATFASKSAKPKPKAAKVLKEITVKTKRGTTYTKKVWVNAEEAPKAQRTKKVAPKPVPKKSKKDEKETGRGAARAAVAEALGLADKSKVDPRQLAEHLKALTRDEIAAINKTQGVTGGSLKQEKIDRLLADIKKKTEGQPDAGTKQPEPTDAGPGRGGAGVGQVPGAGGEVAPVPERPGDANAGPGGDGVDQPAAEASPGRVPASSGAVQARIGRLSNLFRAKGQHQAAEWLDKLGAHVAAVGTDATLASLGEAKPAGKDGGAPIQYEGGWHSMGDFAESYLNRFGIQRIGDEWGNAGQGSGAENTVDASRPVVSSSSRDTGGFDRGETKKGQSKLKKGDVLPANVSYANKLAEAKLLPGLESSEDVSTAAGEPVTHLTPAVTAKFDAQYGPGKWIVKAYGDNAAAGYGIYFPQRAAQLSQDARDTLWTAGEQIGQHGFSLDRNEAGKVVGLKHEDGQTYPFGSEQYHATINGDVRHWGDRAAQAAGSEQAVELPDGGKQFMVQPAFEAAGVSDADRAAGKTIAPGEGRVHIVTRNGKAEIVPYATWIKGEPLPVVFEDEGTKAMAKAAQDAINAMPEADRKGQIYAPDVIKAVDGSYKVVEANPSTHHGASGYLMNNPLVIDAYASHVTGREPAHVQFIRKLLTTKGTSDGTQGGTKEAAQPGAGEHFPGRLGRSGIGRRSEQAPDGSGANGIDPTQSEHSHAPGDLAATLAEHGVSRLPDADNPAGRWLHPQARQDWHNKQVLTAAKKAGVFLPPESLARVTQHSPNVGGGEHDVHEDAANNRFFKFPKNGRFGNNTDVHEYLERHRLANELWPELDYKVHGVTQDAQGRPQTVLSMNRVEGTHPEQHEIDDWFRKQGFVQDEHDHPLFSQRSWRDPETGTAIHDAHSKNFIKTAKGLVPIDVDIQPGESHDSAGFAAFAKDASGHEHKGKGKGGGQFAPTGGGGAAGGDPIASARERYKARHAEWERARAGVDSLATAPEETPVENDAPDAEGDARIAAARESYKARKAAFDLARAGTEAPAATVPTAKPAVAKPHAVAERLGQSLDSAVHLTPAQKQKYKAAIDRVTQSMPTAALDRLQANLKDTAFHGSSRDLSRKFAAESMAALQDMRESGDLGRVANFVGQAIFQAMRDGKIDAGGGYVVKAGRVHLDGDYTPPEADKGDHTTGDTIPTHGIYAHELMHSIDGPNQEITKSPEWQDAFDTEIKKPSQGLLARLKGAAAPQSPLTDYASSMPSEGLAEFGRLVYGSEVPHAQIATEFPKATALFKARGLWPAQERAGAESRLPAVFGQRVATAADGSHADILASKPGG